MSERKSKKVLIYFNKSDQIFFFFFLFFFYFFFQKNVNFQMHRIRKTLIFDGQCNSEKYIELPKEKLLLIQVYDF